MRTLKTLFTCILVFMLATVNIGSATADDGGLYDWVNSHRNSGGMSSLPTKAELATVAQNKANELARADVGLSSVDQGKLPAGYSNYKGFVAKSSSTGKAFQTWLDQGSSQHFRGSWTHIGAGSATGNSGSVFAVVVMASYPAPAPKPQPAPVPAPIPAPQPAPVIPEPQPAPVIPAPVVIPEPVVKEEPAPEPVKTTQAPAPKPTEKPSASPTASSIASPTPVVTTIEVEKRVEVEKHLLSVETKRTLQSGISIFGAGILGLGLLGLGMARVNRPRD